MIDILYFLFSFFALSFLVFIHELGHYWVAKREGFEVEVFSIGFGKPFLVWEWQGVKWQMCYLLFGGYVKIKGMFREGDEKPQTFVSSFFNKSPWQRIKVAVAGPLANILFSLLVFAAIWQFGGLEKRYYDFTKKIGWVSQDSELYKKGVRPGDSILSYDEYPVKRSTDHLYGAMLSGDTVNLKGQKARESQPGEKYFEMEVSPYEDARYENTPGKGIKTLGIESPANLLIIRKGADGKLPILEGSKVPAASIRDQDRIVWMDGYYIFSQQQLVHLLNDQHALLTIKRGSEYKLARVPKFLLFDFKLDEELKNEFTDLAFEAKQKPLTKLFFIPYNLSPNAIVESSLELHKQEKQALAFKEMFLDPYLIENLENGDQIIAVDGQEVSSSTAVLEALQDKKLVTILGKHPESKKLLPFDKVDQSHIFSRAYEPVDKMIKDIGKVPFTSLIHPEQDYHFLDLFSPIKRRDLEQVKSRVMISERNPEEVLASEEFNRLYLGLILQDQQVRYNPDPLTASYDVVCEIGRTLKSLIVGDIHPKWMSGAVGMVHSFQTTLAIWGLDDTLYWMAVISLNLGLFNLLPLPILDGGYILLSCIELVTKKQLNNRVLEYIFLPFFLLLVSLFVYTTFNDIWRIFF